MKMHAGHIYLMKYFHYRNDKEPLILVLYHGMDRNKDVSKRKEVVHGINLNYLSNSNKLTDQVVDFIIQVATKQIKSNDAYQLYHNYIKHKLPKVIAKAYRTYDCRYIGTPIPISKGFDETTTFIKNLNNAQKHNTKDIKQRIKAKIKTAQEKKEVIKKIYNTKQMTSEQILEFVDNYIKLIQKAKIDDTKRTGHDSKFTKRR